MDPDDRTPSTSRDDEDQQDDLAFRPDIARRALQQQDRIRNFRQLSDELAEMADEAYAPIEEYVNLIESNMERLREHSRQMRERRSEASTRTTSPLTGRTASSTLPTSEAGTAESSKARPQKRPPARDGSSSRKRGPTTSPPPKRRDSSESSRASLGSGANLRLDEKLSLAESSASRQYPPIAEDSDEEMLSLPAYTGRKSCTPSVDLRRMTD